MGETFLPKKKQNTNSFFHAPPKFNSKFAPEILKGKTTYFPFGIMKLSRASC